MDMKLKVTVNGTAYDVDVEVEEECPAAALGTFVFGGAGAVSPTAPTNVSAPADEGKVLRAPISGTVMKVVHNAGDEVAAGDVLLILEAMKMETEITAPVSGTIARVEVEPGDAVSGGQILVTWG
jgi:methylmalonyl-CoA carboxyltransferase small subunit